MIFGLARTAQALGQLQTWATDRDGALPKSGLNRLRKLTLSIAQDAQVAPDLEALHYELLRM